MKIKISILIILVSICFLSGFYIFKYYFEAYNNSVLYSDLLIELDKNQEDINNVKSAKNNTSNESIFERYKELHNQNSDMVGWININNTKINYPVMQSIDNPNFYLKHDFKKNESNYGCPYVQENCNVLIPSDNTIIYAHHMKDGSMFAALDKYKSKSFWERHQTITFDTLESHNEYKIISVFKTTVYNTNPNEFKYYNFVNAKNKHDFDNYITKIKYLSLYDTNSSAEFGDKLLTLTTCEYSQSNNRIVVVAKLVK